MSLIFKKITEALNESIKSKDTVRLLTLRSIISQKKDKEIELRSGSKKEIQDEDIVNILNKMMKQRKESISMYEQGGRQDLIDKEKSEIAIIEEFLPQQMSEDEIKAACVASIKDSEAASLKDMGKVMKILKEKYLGKMDFAKAGQLLKETLQNG
jgi:uncharacterized protein